jgi:hypothetical protein
VRRHPGGSEVGLLTEELGEEILAVAAEVRSHVAENGGQSADAKRLVVGNREVVLATDRRGEANVTSRLPRDGVAEAGEGPGELAPGEVSREPHTAISWSRT